MIFLFLFNRFLLVFVLVIQYVFDNNLGILYNIQPMKKQSRFYMIIALVNYVAGYEMFYVVVF
jgi:hypothetical protein